MNEHEHPEEKRDRLGTAPREALAASLLIPRVGSAGRDEEDEEAVTGFTVNLNLSEDPDRLFVIYAHGDNGDFPFCEVWDTAETLEKAKAVGMKVMEKTRYEHVLESGEPTTQWVEIFGPGIEESIGIEEQGGKIVITGEEAIGA